MAGAGHVEVTGLRPLIKVLRGPAFKDVNRELRAASREIATSLVPVVADAVRQSGAPQAAAMAATVRVHSDRVPVVAVGKVNPKFKTKFTRRGAGDSKKRRGSLAHGVVYGPAGGKRSTPVAENYYRIPRDPSGGALGASARNGPIFDDACKAYLKAYRQVLTRHGFIKAGSDVTWGG